MNAQSLNSTTPVALVTGGTRGIGLAIARGLVAQGYQVVAAARTAVSLPEGVTFTALDITDSNAVNRCIENLPRLDVLVNNAGLVGAISPDQPNLPLWDQIMATNLNAAWYSSSAALQRLPDRTGRIINIASVLGLRGVPDQPAYCAAKHGLIGLTRSLALYAAPRGITVNAICPGWVLTDMALQRFEDLGLSPSQAAASIPLGRMTTPEEVGALVAFLAGPGAASITGQAIVVDGGCNAAA